MTKVYENPGYSDFSFEAVILGTEGAGRSAFIARLVRKDYEPNLPPTIGVECLVHKTKVKKRKIHTLLFDTSGQERFEAAREMCYKRAAGAIVVYDVTRRTSFNNMASTIAKYRAHSPDGIVMICAAKVDLGGHHVTRTEGEDLAKEVDALFMETSAKEAQGVNEAFQSFAIEVCRRGGPLVYCSRCARRKHNCEEDFNFV